ncbi:zinc-binding dehydrogenase [Arthrobacter sp. SLBN-100]
MRPRTVAAPAAAPGHTEIRVLRTGLCGTDIGAVRKGRPAVTDNTTMGHEIVGVRVSDGRRVVVNPLVSCGICSFCRSGVTNLCTALQIIGVHMDGGFAEYVSVPDNQVIEVPSECTDEQAGIAEPVATALHAWNRAGFGPGSRVGIVGAGAIGLCVLSVATEKGATNIGVTDVDPLKRDHALKNGATAVSASLEEEYDVVFECVGLEATRKDALNAVRSGGTLILVGLADATAAFDGRSIVTFERSVIGSFGYLHQDFVEALPITAKMSTDWVTLVPLQDGPGLLDGTATPPAGSAKVHLNFAPPSSGDALTLETRSTQ